MPLVEQEIHFEVMISTEPLGRLGSVTSAWTAIIYTWNYQSNRKLCNTISTERYIHYVQGYCEHTLCFMCITSSVLVKLEIKNITETNVCFIPLPTHINWQWGLLKNEVLRRQRWSQFHHYELSFICRNIPVHSVYISRLIELTATI
jgi:hypothetical protein